MFHKRWIFSVGCVAILIVILLWVFNFTEDSIEPSFIKSDGLILKNSLLETGNMDMVGELVVCQAFLDDNPSACETILTEENKEYCYRRLRVMQTFKALWEGDCDSITLVSEYDIKALCNAKKNDCEGLDGIEFEMCNLIGSSNINDCSEELDLLIECKQAIILGNYVSGNDDFCSDISTFLERETCKAIAQKDCSYQNEGIYHDLAAIALKIDHELPDVACNQISRNELKEYCLANSEISEVIEDIRVLTYQLV